MDSNYVIRYNTTQMSVFALRCKRIIRFQGTLTNILMCNIYRKLTGKFQVHILKKVQQNNKKNKYAQLRKDCC